MQTLIRVCVVAIMCSLLALPGFGNTFPTVAEIKEALLKMSTTFANANPFRAGNVSNNQFTTASEAGSLPAPAIEATPPARVIPPRQVNDPIIDDCQCSSPPPCVPTDNRGWLQNATSPIRSLKSHGRNH
ncbi:hypothetical protein [Stieleria varia]|nr:hypothetical protein [Stieleria varia]